MTTTEPLRAIRLTRKPDRRFVYLIRDGSPPTAVEERLWRVGLHLAVAGGWAPEGCIAPWLPEDRREDYWTPMGQRILKGDAKALGAAIPKGLEKYRRQESGLLRLFPHAKAVRKDGDSRHAHDGLVWFSGGQYYGLATLDLFDLLHRMRNTHPTEMEPEGEVTTALRDLAADLRRGADVTLLATPPTGWYAPGTEMLTIEVLPAADVGLRFRGAVYPPGTRLEVTAEELEALPAKKVQRLNEDGTLYIPPHRCNCPHCVESQKAGVAA